MEARFREAIEAYIAAEAKPREKFGHQPRLYALTRIIGASHRYDDDVVFAAVWLHDLGVFTGHRPEDPVQLAQWDNTAYAMRCAPELLRSFGFPEQRVNAVVEVIRTHQPSGDPTTLEGLIVRDADILEQLGAIAVLRTVCKVGRDTRFATFTQAMNSLRRSLAELPNQLRLDSSRLLARPKIAALQSFIDSVDAEARDALC